MWQHLLQRCDNTFYKDVTSFTCMWRRQLTWKPRWATRIGHSCFSFSQPHSDYRGEPSFVHLCKFSEKRKTFFNILFLMICSKSYVTGGGLTKCTINFLFFFFDFNAFGSKLLAKLDPLIHSAVQSLIFINKVVKHCIRICLVYGLVLSLLYIVSLSLSSFIRSNAIY